MFRLGALIAAFIMSLTVSHQPSTDVSTTLNNIAWDGRHFVIVGRDGNGYVFNEQTRKWERAL